MVTASRQIEDGEEGCRLSGASQHCRGAALKSADFGRDHIIGRILQSRIKISGSLKIKELTHILTGIVFESSTLNDRNLA